MIDMGVDRHLELIGSKVLEGIGHYDVTLEAQYRELLESTGHDFL